MKKPAEPLFLARQGYRRRRLGDASRLLPVLGAALFVAPFVGTVAGGRTTAGVGLFLFAVWLALIVGAGLLGRALTRDRDGAG
jgi:hypothetical protein